MASGLEIGYGEGMYFAIENNTNRCILLIPLSANFLLDIIIRKRLLDPAYPTGDGPSDREDEKRRRRQ